MAVKVVPTGAPPNEGKYTDPGSYIWTLGYTG